VALALLALAVVAAGASVELLRIRHELDEGQELLADLDLTSVGDGLEPTAREALDHLHAADRRADHSPFLAPMSVLPGLGDQVDALRDLTEVAERLGVVGLEAARAIDPDLERAGRDPSARVDLLETVLRQLDRLDATVRDIDVGAEGRLVGPVARARATVVAELDRLPDRLEDARRYAQGVHRLLEGPSRYLLLGANNAEMRGGAGMPLTAAVLTIEDGDIDFSDTVQLSGLDVGEPEVEYPDEWRTTYRRWRPGRSYLSTAVSPNFPITGPIYRAMAPTAGLGQVDGVLELDAVGLRYLLAAIGPVELDGVTYDASNIERQVLFENYLRFSANDDRADRLEVQSRLAGEIFDAFKARDIPVTELATALQTAAKGRHLLAHSADPDAQALWQAIGADGALPAGGLMVTAQNVSANKQDWFLDPHVQITTAQAADGAWRIRLTVSIANPVPARTSPYIDGSYRDLRNGDHRTMIAVYLPRAAYGIRSLDETFSDRGEDPPLRMFAKRIVIRRGDARHVTIDFSMPASKPGAVILPSGRVRPVRYQVNDLVTDDATSRLVLWGAPAGPEPIPAAATVAAFLALGAAVALLPVARQTRQGSARPLVAPSRVVLRLPSLSLWLLAAAGAMLLALALGS
jgi:hypothetical protein